AQEGYFYNQLAPDQELVQRVAESGRRHQPVIVLVDPWTALLDRFREILRQLDALNMPTINIVVLENGDDEESRENLPQLRSGIRNALQHAATAQESRLETVTTEPDFRICFSKTLVDSFLRMLRLAEPLPRITPTIALPKIGGPRSQE